MKKFIAILWMVFAVFISVFALAGILYHFGLADKPWGGAFAGLGDIYFESLESTFSPLDDTVNSVFGNTAPYWVLNTFVFILAIAGAFAVARRLVKNRSAGTILLGILAATGLSYGVARTANPNETVLAKYESLEDESFANALAEQCAQTFNKHGRSAPYLQNNFEKALDRSDWKKAERTASVINEFSACLSSNVKPVEEARRRAGLASSFSGTSGSAKHAWVDITRVNLGLADSFYAAERWMQALNYYEDGFAAFENVVREYLGTDVNAHEPVTHQNMDLSILFNSETIYVQRINQLSAMAHLTAEHQSHDIEFSAMTQWIQRLQSLRSSYYVDTSEYALAEPGSPKPIATRLRADGRTVVAETVEQLIEIAQTLETEEDQVLAVQHFNALLDLYRKLDRMGDSDISVAGPSPDVRQYWRKLGDQINTKHQALMKNGNMALAPFQFSIFKRLADELVAPELWNIESGNGAFNDEFLREAEEYAVRLANVGAGIEPDRLPDLLKIAPGDVPETNNGFDTRIDPYDTLSRILSVQGRNETALQAFEARALYQLKIEPLTRTQIKFVVSDYLTFGLEASPYTVKQNLTKSSDPESLIIQQRWSDISRRICAEPPFKDRSDLSPSCPDYLLRLIFPSDTWYNTVGGGVPFSAVEKAKGTLSTMVMIDLLFGTTRAYDDESPTAEMMFTKNDDPEARGWRGQALLSAPEENLGTPLLADAFLKGSDRAAHFKFIERPNVFGYDTEAHRAFNAVLKDRLRNTKKNEVLIFVHGVGNTFDTAAKRTAQLTYDLSFPGQAMFYTWPTEDSFFGYFKDINVAPMAIEDLAKFIDEADNSVKSACNGIADCEPGKVNIIAHSHGARVTKDALEILAKKRADAGRSIRLGQVIFAAPDVDGKKLRNAVDKNLSQISDQVTIYTNNSDKALWGSSLLRFFKWRGGLGKKGTCSARMIDASSAVPFGSHSYFAQESEVIADLRTSLWHGDLGPQQRCYLSKKKKKSFAGWKFNKENCDITAYDLASQIAIRAQQTDEVDFDRLYTDLIGNKQIRDATNESRVQNADPNNWTTLNVISTASAEINPVRVLRPRYEKAKTVYAEFTSGKTDSETDPCSK